MPNPAPILALIRHHESEGAVRRQAAASAYDVVWGGIKPTDRPQKPLTEMTVGQVLSWQDRIDARYQSEAAGAYQVMEDTLRGLGLDPEMRFDEKGQDAIAMKLLVRRGWERLLRGEITAGKFGDNLAREWASLPVLSDQKGASREVKRGQSYYAGDGLNKAHAKPEEVEYVIREALTFDDVPVTPSLPWGAEPEPELAPTSSEIADLRARVEDLEAWAAKLSYTLNQRTVL